MPDRGFLRRVWVPCDEDHDPQDIAGRHWTPRRLALLAAVGAAAAVILVLIAWLL
jgi:hypothetical protein